MEFIVSDASCLLEVQIKGKVYPLITPAFLWLDERDEALSYLHRVADRLNEFHSAGHADQVTALLGHADRHVHHRPHAGHGDQSAEFAKLLG